jgi:hypothetical protein
MSKLSESDFRRLTKSASKFRQHVLAFPMHHAFHDYQKWSINPKSPMFKERQARMHELVGLLLSRDKYGRLKFEEPSAEKIEQQCDRMVQTAVDHFKKRPAASQISMLAPCVSLEGKSMPRWFMFYNEDLFRSLSSKSGFSVIQGDLDDPGSLLEAVSAMGVRGNPVELLRRTVAAQLKIELDDPQSDGLLEDEMGELFESEESMQSKIMKGLLNSHDGPYRKAHKDDQD